MRSRSPARAAATAALVSAALLIGPTSGALAVEQSDDGAPARQIGDDAQSRQLAFPQTPRDVRVETDADGYVVFGTPICTGWGLYECKSGIASGSDASHASRIDTRHGYRISWPSSWKEGETRHVGYLFSLAKDWIAWWYSPNARADLGWVTRPYAPRALTATVTSKDDAARTARVSGTATPGATIELGGTPVATADQSGNWSYTVTGLSVGANSRTFQQYVDGSYKDQKTVSVTIVDPVQPDQITGDRGSATLERGKTTTVYSTFTPKRAFTTPTGRFEVTAPAGTTFAPGQDGQRGEYRSGSSWFAFGGDSLVNGARSSDGRTYSFDLGQRNWDVAKDQKFRFGLRVETPVDVSTTTSSTTGHLSGSFTGATFDTTATTDTTVADQPLTARVAEVDSARRTATVEGTAPGIVTSIEVSWERNGQVTTRRTEPSDGKWTVDVDGLRDQHGAGGGLRRAAVARPDLRRRRGGCPGVRRSRVVLGRRDGACHGLRARRRGRARRAGGRCDAGRGDDGPSGRDLVAPRHRSGPWRGVVPDGDTDGERAAGTVHHRRGRLRTGCSDHVAG